MDRFATDELGQAAQVRFNRELDALVVVFGRVALGATAQEDEVETAQILAIAFVRVGHLLKVDIVVNLLLGDWGFNCHAQLNKIV